MSGTWTFQTVNFPGAVQSWVEGVNDSGVIAGDYAINGQILGFTFSENRFDSISFPGAQNTEFAGIDEEGRFYGNTGSPYSYATQAFVESQGTYSIIDFPQSSFTGIWGVNNSGEAVGNYTIDGTNNGFILNDGSFSTVTAPPGGPSTSVDLTGVSESGVLFGSYSALYNNTGIVIAGGEITNIVVPGVNTAPSFQQAGVEGVTASGTIYGYYFDDSDSTDKGFVDVNGTYETIVFPGTSDNRVVGVDSAGDIFGTFPGPSGVQSFEYFDGVYTMIEVPGSGSTAIAGVTSSGEIYGSYQPVGGGYEHGFVAEFGGLFTIGADNVNFNNLNTSQQQAVAAGAYLYDGLGGGDVVVLPNVANYNESVGNGQTLNWDPRQTFFTGSQPGDTYSVTGGDGSYKVALGAGSDHVTIDGDGSSAITGGAGAGTINIDGSGVNTIDGGSGQDVIDLSGGGGSTITVNGGAATLTLDSGANGIDLMLLASAAEITAASSNLAQTQVAFAGASTTGQVLKLDNAAGFNGSITGFAASDTIDLTNVGSVTNLSWSNGVLALRAGGQAIDLNVALDPSVGPNAAFSSASDGHGGTDIQLGPSVTDYLLASELAYDATLPGYSNNTTSYVAALQTAGFSPLQSSSSDPSGMAAEAFIDTTTKQIIVAFRGTVFAPCDFPAQTYQDLVQLDAGGIFLVKPQVMAPVFAAALGLVQSIEQADAGYTIYLSGHSLGGAEAEAVAAALAAMPGGFPDVFGGGATFAAPGVSALLTGATNLVGTQMTDYVIANDAIATFSNDVKAQSGLSNAGAHVGQVVVLNPTSLLGELTGTVASNVFGNGLLTGLLSVAKGIDLPEAVFGLPQHFLASYGQALVNAGIISSDPLLGASSDPVASSSAFDLSALFSGIQNLAVTVANCQIVQTGVLDVQTAISTAVVELKETLTEAGTTIFSEIVQSGENFAQQVLSVTSSGTLTDQISIDGTQIDNSGLSAGDPAALNIGADGSILVGVSSPTAGDEITLTVSPTGHVGVASGGDSSVALDTFDQFALAPDEVLNVGAVGANGSATVSQTLAPTLLPDHFLADGVSDLLIENSSGAVVAGEVTSGAINYTQLAGLGPEWSFKGSGDFIGDGDSDFLIENTAGAVAVGDVVNGTAVYTTVAGLGAEWSFVGAGDYLGDGKSDFLIENTSGSVVVGEVQNGSAVYTQVAGLGVSSQ